MSWQLSKYSHYYPFFERGRTPSGSGMINERCFIRKEHKCGKMYGASKSCFIACPSDDDLNPILALMSEKLSKLGIEPSIAIKDRAYGQDIFCTKICGKIIESRFCIVILDDSIKDSVSIPNPNVYYEYGLMTALRKHIIPLQKEKLKLAFNIQSHDTIKYSARNIDTELERGIRDAVKISEATEPEKARGALTERGVLRKMELAGFTEKGDKWFLSEVIEDTAFKGFGHDEKGFYAYVGKIDDQEDIRKYLDDLDIVIYRTEHKMGSMEAELEGRKAQRESFQKSLSQADLGISTGLFKEMTSSRRYEYERFSRSISELDEKISEINDRISLMKTFYIGFIVASDVTMTKFLELAKKKVEPYPRYKVICSQAGKIQFGYVCVDYDETQR